MRREHQFRDRIASQLESGPADATRPCEDRVGGCDPAGPSGLGAARPETSCAFERRVTIMAQAPCVSSGPGSRWWHNQRTQAARRSEDPVEGPGVCVRGGTRATSFFNSSGALTRAPRGRRTRTSATNLLPLALFHIPVQKARCLFCLSTGPNAVGNASQRRRFGGSSAGSNTSHVAPSPVVVVGDSSRTRAASARRSATNLFFRASVLMSSGGCLVSLMF